MSNFVTTTIIHNESIKDTDEFAKKVRLNLKIKVRKIPAGGGDGRTTVW